MRVPQEIADKVKAYTEASKTASRLYNEAVEWLNEHTDSSGVYINDLHISDAPRGEEQADGEYCDQRSIGFTGDSFEGTYFHAIDGSGQYLAYDYDC